MKLRLSTHKLLFSLTAPTLLFGCAPQPIVYQQPAPVYRGQQHPPQAITKPVPARKPKPKVETYGLSNEPIIAESIGEPPKQAPEETPAPTTAVPLQPAPIPEVSNESAASAGYNAPSVEVSGSPAVLALLGDAERSSKSGDLNSAAATVERAMNIDSRNASLVYRLAQIRLQQNQPRLAEGLAKKAAALAENNRELKKNCWLLIAKARYMQGNKQGAEEARGKAEQL